MFEIEPIRVHSRPASSAAASTMNEGCFPKDRLKIGSSATPRER